MSTPPSRGTGAGEFRASFEVAADHPSLAGHFPGHPLVPGVLILDRLLDALAAWEPAGSSANASLNLIQVKFLAPLKPGVPAEAVLTRSNQRLGFRIEQDGRVLVQGQLA